MKNAVDEIILSFSNQELREFKYLLSSGNPAIDERADLRMVDDIRRRVTQEEKNVNAHHQTRKRLKKQLEQYTVLENLRSDDFSRIHSLMETAKYLFRKNLHRQAWEYLLRAEQLAINAEEYRLLDYNYDIQISYSHNVATHPPRGFSVPELLQKWNDNKALAMIESAANAALAELIYELRKQFSSKFSVNIDELISTILDRYKLNESLYKNQFRIYCKIVNLVCRVLREKREYHSLKTYAINSYKTIKKQKAIDKVSNSFLVDLFDDICVATLRSKDYQLCEEYTGLYEIYAKKMQAHQNEYSYYDFIPAVGISDLCLCMNKPGQARQAMLNAKAKYADYNESPRIFFLLRINLLAVHFTYDEYDNCIKLYNEIKTLSDRKILGEPGFRLELILFTDIYGVIFHYETGDPGYALYRLEKLKRKYSVLLNQADCRREKRFVKLLEKILSQPGFLRTERFANEAQDFMGMKEFIAGDFEYISMNAWINSKLTRNSYYQCFLELVQ